MTDKIVEEIMQIRLEEIQSSPTNPRTVYNAKSIEELAASIREVGLIQPVRVRPHPTKAGVFELVIGERRLRAHKLLNAPTILAIVREYGDDEVIEVQNIENVQRQDIHPLDEARSYKLLLAIKDEKSKQPRYTVDDLAVKMGKSKSYIWQTLTLLKLIPDIQKYFAKDQINKNQAILVARLTEEQQQEILKDVIADEIQWHGVVSTEELKEEIEVRYHFDFTKVPFNKADAQLVPEAGPCTTCPKRTGSLPDLFEDFGKKDRCTDKKCFEAKKQALYVLNLHGLKKSGETFVEITTDSFSRKKSVLNSGEYEVVKAGAKGAVPAIHVNQDRQGAIVHVKPKRIPMLEAKDGHVEPVKQTKKELSYEEREKKRIERIKRCEKRVKAIFIELVKAIPTKFQKQWIPYIIRLLQDNNSNAEIVLLANAISGKEKEVDIAKAEAIVLKELGTIKYLWFLTFCSMTVITYEGSIHEPFFQLCRQMGIDYKSIMKKIDNEEKQAQKLEKEKAEQPAAKGKGKTKLPKK